MNKQHNMYAIPPVLYDPLPAWKQGPSNAQNVITPPIMIAIVLNALAQRQ